MPIRPLDTQIKLSQSIALLSSDTKPPRPYHQFQFLRHLSIVGTYMTFAGLYQCVVQLPVYLMAMLGPQRNRNNAIWVAQKRYILLMTCLTEITMPIMGTQVFSGETQLKLASLFNKLEVSQRPPPMF